jgi:hypothetical protein
MNLDNAEFDENDIFSISYKCWAHQKSTIPWVTVVQGRHLCDAVSFAGAEAMVAEGSNL